ncbi:hypothetical protein G5V58_12950 [Nocardioides anomalus]|uniref:Uncharacterized protein n=1 Tax=Nocardioides anomalus TaxID=2712223 RepID=A0A6G6WEB2_9ACTN|nr:hypothetical protein [Nocardioides anomalus]QIG43546.1 hypothetical protein G5V58_12950 [Nocardioides anomalus]
MTRVKTALQGCSPPSYRGDHMARRTALTSVSATAAVIGAALVALSAPATAAATADTTPPALTAPARGAFVPKSQISATELDRYGDPTSTELTMLAQWSASDPSRICGYSTREVFEEYATDWTPWSRQTRLTRDVSDYDDQEGGGSLKFNGIDVRARDCAGNISTAYIDLQPVVFQQDGRSYGYGNLTPPTTTGAWSTSSCACWSAGTTLKSSAKGARLDFHLPAGLTPEKPATTTPLALVMERAPDRGKARILVDGVQVAFIDTGSSTKLHRSVTWTGSVTAAVPHTISVVNVATSGRSRLDVDALLTNGIASMGQPLWSSSSAG